MCWGTRAASELLVQSKWYKAARHKCCLVCMCPVSMLPMFTSAAQYTRDIFRQTPSTSLMERCTQTASLLKSHQLNPRLFRLHSNHIFFCPTSIWRFKVYNNNWSNYCYSETWNMLSFYVNYVPALIQPQSLYIHTVAPFAIWHFAIEPFDDLRLMLWNAFDRWCHLFHWAAVSCSDSCVW